MVIIQEIYLGQMIVCNIMSFFSSIILIGFYYYFGVEDRDYSDSDAISIDNDLMREFNMLRGKSKGENSLFYATKSSSCNLSNEEL